MSSVVGKGCSREHSSVKNYCGENIRNLRKNFVYFSKTLDESRDNAYI